MFENFKGTYELVQKCIRSNIPIIVSVSAPTTMAVEMAERNNLTLVALVEDN